MPLDRITEIRREAMQALRPPPKLRLSDWIEANVRLPEGVSAQPGPVRLWPFQREIADAIGDPFIERVTLVKPVRVGFGASADFRPPHARHFDQPGTGRAAVGQWFRRIHGSRSWRTGCGRCPAQV
ncbi:phage terminase large subunit family protein [Paracoccus sp. TD-10]|uniref:phage terminase large subunit family protein n=1 Tax=Paracoccus TaxID=265 RepID=UPI001FCC87AE|nr:phage terminase large subunit family protein [Paracoccus pantotrophus]